MTDLITVKPGEVIDRATGNVAAFATMPVSPTEKVTADDPRWSIAVAANCGTDDRVFTQQHDGTYAPEDVD